MLRNVRHLPFPLSVSCCGLPVAASSCPIVAHLCGGGVFSFQWFGGRRVRSSVEKPSGSVVGQSGQFSTANNPHN